MIKKFQYTLLLFVIILSNSGCNSNKTKTTEVDNKKVITVSILPQKGILDKILDTNYIINVLMPPGASHATYEPTPAQLNNLSRSDIFFTLGLFDFENAWHDNFQSANKQIKIIPTGINYNALVVNNHIHSHDHDSENGHICKDEFDPHIWLSVSGLKYLANEMCKTLIMSYPEDSLLISNNLNNYIVYCDSIEKVIKSTIEDSKIKSFLIFHPSLGYYSADNNLEQIAIEYEGKEAPVKYLNELISSAKQKKLKDVLVSTEFDTKQAKVVAEKLNGKIIQFEPMRPDAIDNLLHITKILSDNNE